MNACESVDAGEIPEGALSRAIGEELRRAREALGWSKQELVARLPSGIVVRTLESYEQGTRHFTALRFIEICRALKKDPPTLLRRALQQVRADIEILILRVDLRALLGDRNDAFRPLVVWARNMLNACPGGVAEIEPLVVQHLAYSIGCSHLHLADYLARFLPQDPADATATTTNESGRRG